MGGSASQGLGGAPDNDGGKAGWINAWTIFYWGWWISWAPFVGTFIARISKGRRLGPVIIASLILPSLWSFAFMGVFGAAQIRISNQAITATQECVRKLPISSNITTSDACFKTGTCTGCKFTYGSKADPTKFGWMVPQNKAKGIQGGWQPVSSSVTRLFNLGTEDVLFEHLGSYGGKGWATFTTVITLICIIMYFVTSSDSASYVVDILAANGQEEPPLAQKIFWACTEGAGAAALLLSAGDDQPKAALNAVKALPIVLGLPYTFHLFWCCQSLLLICKEEAGEIAIVRKNFTNFLLFNLQPMSFVSFIFPFVPLGTVASKAWGGPQILYWTAFGLEWAFFLTMLCLGGADKAFLSMAVAAYFCFALTAASVRSSVRELLGITGDLVSDVCACCFYLPFAMGQMAGEDFMKIKEPSCLENEKETCVEKEQVGADMRLDEI